MLSVTFNTVLNNPSFSVTQFNVFKSPNNFQFDSPFYLFEFPRGMGGTSIITTLDQQYLIASSFTGVIAKMDITNANHTNLVSSSYLLGAYISLGANDDVIAVVVSNSIYDYYLNNNNFSI